MCYEYDLEVMRRAEEARKELKKAEGERQKQKPQAPVEVPEEKPVPV